MTRPRRTARLLERGDTPRGEPSAADLLRAAFAVLAGIALFGALLLRVTS